MTRAGMPPTTVFAGTSFVTTAPAAITAPAPTVTPPRTVTPAPTHVPSPIEMPGNETFPARRSDPPTAWVSVMNRAKAPMLQFLPNVTFARI